MKAPTRSLVVDLSLAACSKWFQAAGDGAASARGTRALKFAICSGRSTTVVTTAFLVVAACVASANAQALGPEFQVNSDAEEFQQWPDVAADGLGNFVVVWQSFPQPEDGSENDVFGRRFDAAGIPKGDDFPVNAGTSGSQAFPAVAADGAGNFVVVWQDSVQDGSSFGVFARRFDSAGVPLDSEFQVNTYTLGPQGDVGVAADLAGNFLVVWESEAQDGSNRGVFGQRFDASGDFAGSEFQINTYTTGNQQDPAVAAIDSGGWIVAWTGSGEQDGSLAGVFGQRLDPEGSKIGDEFQINTSTLRDQFNPSVAVTGAGSFVVAWQDYDQGTLDDINAQQFDAAGERVGVEFQANTYKRGIQWNSAVAADAVGNFVIVWDGRDDQDGEGGGTFLQRYDSSGETIGSELQANVYTDDFQIHPTAAASRSGSLFVAWASICFDAPCTYQDGSGSGIFARVASSSVFSDDFELGDACAWSDQEGSKGTCG